MRCSARSACSDGDVVIAIASSGLHSNGFSLVRHILAQRGIGYTDTLAELGGVVGEALLEPTRLYTSPLLRLLDDLPRHAVHSLSHVTGGGIAANLARVLPRGSWVELDRSTLVAAAGVPGARRARRHRRSRDTEGTWNLGIGMIAVVDAGCGDRGHRSARGRRHPAWVVGRVSTGARDLAGFEQGAKGVDGGAVRLVGSLRRLS